MDRWQASVWIALGLCAAAAAALAVVGVARGWDTWVGESSAHSRPHPQRRRVNRNVDRWLRHGDVPRLSVSERMIALDHARWLLSLWWVPWALATAAGAVTLLAVGARRPDAVVVTALGLLGVAILAAAVRLHVLRGRARQVTAMVRLPESLSSDGARGVGAAATGTGARPLTDVRHRFVTTIDGDAAAVADLRRAVRDELTQWQAEDGPAEVAVDDVVLVVTELAANAVRHGSGQVGVEITGRLDGLGVAVTDHSSTPPRTRADADLWDESGRGMQLVAAVSRTWGVSPASYGKTVWCDLGPAARQAGARAS